MNTTNVKIFEQIQNLLEVFEQALVFPLPKERAFLLERHTWILDFYLSARNEFLSLQQTQMGRHTKFTIKSEYKKNLDFFVKKLRDAHCLVYRCDTRKVPRWMRRERNEAFIVFFERVLKKLSTVESNVMAMLIYVIEKGIEYYKQDFEEYKKAETSEYLSRSDYKKLCLLKRSLEVNLGFLKESI